ncbi:MAG: outer membrane protein assembly factor BamE [Verrucomicrobia bacterium]|nr:outer membrane protein assembly factor BamE [Verrucomicrobiota bacterium]
MSTTTKADDVAANYLAHRPSLRTDFMLTIFVSRSCLIAVVVVVVCLCACYPYPVSKSELGKLRSGYSTREDVRKALGPPQEIQLDGNVWHYYRTKNPRSLYIYFTTNGLYSSYEEDE